MKPATKEIIVDSFAGGGGASTGIKLATGREVDIAINHDPDAILMHKTNHPNTMHYQADVWDVDPVEVCAGRPVGLLWESDTEAIVIHSYRKARSGWSRAWERIVWEALEGVDLHKEDE